MPEKNAKTIQVQVPAECHRALRIEAAAKAATMRDTVAHALVTYCREHLAVDLPAQAAATQEDHDHA